MVTSDSSQPEDYAGLVDTQDKGRNYLFYIVIIVFVLVLVGYFAVQSPEQEIELEAPLSHEEADSVISAQIEASQPPVTSDQPEKQPQVEATDSLSSSDSAPKPTLAAPVKTADMAALQANANAASGISAGAAARSLINSVRQGEKDLTMEQFFNQASEHQNQAMSTDAYLLYFFAARKGHGPSAFELAKMHDPAHFEGGSDLLEKPDPVQAYKWYSIAVESDVDGAEERLQALRGSIEAAAQDGDMSAQRLILNWK